MGSIEIFGNRIGKWTPSTYRAQMGMCGFVAAMNETDFAPGYQGDHMLLCLDLLEPLLHVVAF